eukprot:Pompholyxophrys_punicea_v1_NODE_74_length_3737_cov_17.706953.p1 type:complete len:218 gc:universal NODE_74_length_3737_cov_17.706953:1406-753(-)
MSDDEALALLVDCDLSKESYQKIRNNALQHSVYIYPPYNNIRNEKKKTYPKEQTFTPISAETTLQSLLDVTLQRLVQNYAEVLRSLPDINEYDCVSKWEYDSATGQSIYKQIWGENIVADDNMFATNLVPLRITYNGKLPRQIFWNNPAPSSTMFCRPLRLQFLKESEVVNLAENTYWQKNKIETLKPTRFDFEGRTIIINHKLHETMLDGKKWLVI